ncbi:MULTISPECIES: YciI family protein [Streptomyces]|uniref:YciI family protein n=1 Tax=Streptomyces solicathayae TaxID=3081768 RepID=A0ABZ0LVC5_9ACTN|nr:YciI family protein [Streptomyces sp. HUAS YS2]WOX23418.1 YciI family protein [Streptomyces sp. HUAS YS2]
MKYMVMVLGSQTDYDAMKGEGSAQSPVWTHEDVQNMVVFMNELNEELTASGEMLDGQGLTEPARTRFVTASPIGGPTIRDNPYDRSQELLAGYWILDCASLDRVTEIAARITQCPVPAGSPDYPVVIRPIDEVGPGR